jgi:hypothetical protein
MYEMQQEFGRVKRKENAGHAFRVINPLDVDVLPTWKIRARGASYNKYILAD